MFSPTPTRTDDQPAPTLGTTSADGGLSGGGTGLARRLPTFGLSLTQLIATALAATTATVAASFLGVTGTVIGAALASVTTAVGNAVYGQSLRRGRDRVRTVVPVLTRPEPTPPARRPGVRRLDVVPVLKVDPVPTIEPGVPVLPAGPPVRLVVWKRVALVALSVFVVVLAVVTGVEVVAGRPIADVVRGDSGSGTSFFGGSTVVTRTRTVSPTVPATTVTVTPKVVTSTPTVTRTAPATTKTATSGTTTVTPAPSATSSPTPSGSPSATSTPAG